MHVRVILAIASPEIIAIVVLGGIVLFGAERLPKLARSFVRARQEYAASQRSDSIAAPGDGPSSHGTQTKLYDGRSAGASAGVGASGDRD